jgi:isopentenyl phosphate kinase
MCTLAKRFKPSRAVFAVDVDGIYTKNPKYKDAELLARLSSEDVSRVSTDLTYLDVTGGMSGKLKSIAEIARMGIEVVVVNGNKRDRLYRALTGRRTTCTIVSD